MKSALARLAAVLFPAALCAPLPSQAGFNGDTVTLSYSLLSMPAASFSSASAIVGAGAEFTGSATDGFGQQWQFTIDVADASVNFSWVEATRAGVPNGGNIASGADAWNFDLAFAATPIPAPWALTAFSSSGYFSPHTPSMTNLVSAGNAFHIGFERLDSTDSYTVSAVPEPETWALLLAGMGLLGVAARRKA